MVQLAAEGKSSLPESQKPTEKNQDIDNLHTAESQRAFLEKHITGVNRDKRIEAALLFVSGLMTSTKQIAERMKVVKHTVIRWKKKDGWLELANETAQITRASLSTSATPIKARLIRSLEEDLALIDLKKHEVKAKSLEGLLKAKAMLQGELTKLLGIGMVEEPRITIVFGGYGEAPAPRGAVKVPGKEIPVETDGTPGIGALVGGAIGGGIEGVAEGENAGKGSSVEIPRSKSDNEESAPEQGGGAEKARVALRGRSLPGGKTETKTDLTLEEAMS